MGTRFLRFSSMTLLMLPITVAAANGLPVAAPDAPDEARALTQMAVRYEHAEGVARDLHLATKLYCRAARIGRAEAQYRLGWMYANGRGVPRDDAIAAALFAMAAAQGHAQSQRILLYVRPKSATMLPACMLVTAGIPELKLSRELSVAENAGANHDVYADTPDALDARPAMHAAR